VLGSNIDAIVGRAPCEASLVKVQGDRTGDVVALAGEGPHAPVAARRAREFAAGATEASLTLLNVQQPDDEQAVVEEIDNQLSPDQRGEALIERVADEAGVDEDGYDAVVVVAEDVEAAILEHVNDFDTVCVGATRMGSVSQALFGSLPERVGEQADATVAMVRGSKTSPVSVREAIVRRLSE
jgi:nucleotide-binding universal stress UspA family protein